MGETLRLLIVESRDFLDAIVAGLTSVFLTSLGLGLLSVGVPGGGALGEGPLIGGGVVACRVVSTPLHITQYSNTHQLNIYGSTFDLRAIKRCYALLSLIRCSHGNITKPLTSGLCLSNHFSCDNLAYRLIYIRLYTR